jgi:hypothetical protein
MLAWRLLLAPVLLAQAAALAQPAYDPAAEVGAWAAGFIEAVSEPNIVAARCAPAMNAALASMRDSASARAAMVKVRPCGEQIRSAYAGVNAKLDGLHPLPPEIEAKTGFSSARFIADQRRLAAATTAYVDDLNRFIDAMAAGDRAALPGLLARVRTGGGSLMDASILMLRLQQSASRLAFVRRAMELRIVLAEAAKGLLVAVPTAAGLPVGNTMRVLAGRARAAVPAARMAWQEDRVILTRLSGHETSSVTRVLAAGGQLTEDMLSRGDRLATLLDAAGRRPVLPHLEAQRLATELNNLELDMLRSGQAFATALQAEG